MKSVFDAFSSKVIESLRDIYAIGKEQDVFKDIPLEVVPMQKEYFDTVVDYTINEVKEGRTPNPDVMCNNNIKFGIFLDKIDNRYDYHTYT